MGWKFRNSLFGFNKEDVLSFVVESRNKENLTEKELTEIKQELSDSKAELESVKTKYYDADTKLTAALEELEKFKAKEQHIDRLCESIGKLYLVAQSNAASIIESAKQSRDESEKLVNSNLSAADEATRRFDEMGTNLKAKTEEFLRSIDELKNLAAETKETVNSNNEEIEKHSKEAECLLAFAGADK